MGNWNLRRRSTRILLVTVAFVILVGLHTARHPDNWPMAVAGIALMAFALSGFILTG